MSRDLPPVPNLDHLRNQAKALLDELRPIAPSAKLADAQRVIARQYGFRSWPKLKAHVESVGADPNPDPGPSARAALRKRMQSILDERMRAGGVFVRYTEYARRAVFFSRYEAHRHGSDSIGTEHLLLGLIRGGDDLSIQTFMRAGVAMDRIRTEMEERIQSRAASAGDVPISPDGREALRRAAEEADRLGHRAIQTPHLLLGLLGDEGTPAGSVLAANGMGLEKARTDVAEVLGDAEA